MLSIILHQTQDKPLSATNMFLSFEIDSARICLFIGSIASHHNQIYSEPTLSNVSSTMYSEILFLLFVNILLG